MILETQSIKEQKMVGYRFVDNYETYHYELVDFATGNILDKMSEVAIVYDGDVLLKHGNPERLIPYYRDRKEKYRKYNLDTELGYIQGKLDIDELDKILSISDYIGRFAGLYEW